MSIVQQQPDPPVVVSGRWIVESYKKVCMYPRCIMKTALNSISKHTALPTAEFELQALSVGQPHNGTEPLPRRASFRTNSSDVRFANSLKCSLICCQQLEEGKGKKALDDPKPAAQFATLFSDEWKPLLDAPVPQPAVAATTMPIDQPQIDQKPVPVFAGTRSSPAKHILPPVIEDTGATSETPQIFRGRTFQVSPLFPSSMMEAVKATIKKYGGQMTKQPRMTPS